MTPEEPTPTIQAATWKRLDLAVKDMGIDLSNGLPEHAHSETDPALAERTAQYQANRQRYEQHRLEQILRITAQELDTQADTTAPTLKPDSGWWGQFLQCARQAGDDTTQQILARLLARELTTQNSVSRRTLHSLSTLDLWELESFIEYTAFAFAFDSGWRFIFEEEPLRREIWTYGREIDITTHLVRIGLLNEQPDRILTRSACGIIIRYQDKRYTIEHVKTEETPAGFLYRRYTPTGQQLANALKTKRFNGYARNVVARLKEEMNVHLELVEE